MEQIQEDIQTIRTIAMTWNNWISEYLNSNISNIFLEDSQTYLLLEKYLAIVHFLKQMNNNCDMAQLHFKLPDEGYFINALCALN